MNLKLLRAFLTVADAAHFGRAASVLCITQPALSKQMLLLEAELGARLFERGRHGAELTAFGALFLPDARRLLQDADAALARARQASVGERGRLHIGFGLSTLDVAPQYIAAFRRECPEVDVVLNDFSSAEQTRRLLSGQLDLGFIRLPAGARLDTLPLLDEELALAVPDQGGRTNVPVKLAELNKEGFVMLARERGPGLAAQIDRWCADRGFLPRVVQTADDIQTVLAIVAAGIALALLPRRAALLLNGGVRMLPLGTRGSHWEVGLAWRSGRQTAAVDRFVALLRSAGAGGRRRGKSPPAGRSVRRR